MFIFAFVIPAVALLFVGDALLRKWADRRERKRKPRPSPADGMNVSELLKEQKNPLNKQDSPHKIPEKNIFTVSMDTNEALPEKQSESKTIDIKKVYDEVIGIVMQGVERKYATEVETGYMDYLNEQSKIFGVCKDKDKAMAELIKLEVSRWSRRSRNEKLSQLLEDEAFRNINEISYEGYKAASLRAGAQSCAFKADDVLPTIDIEEAERNINLLIKYLDEVREFNKAFAEGSVSEGIVDYLYASGKTKATSLRIGPVQCYNFFQISKDEAQCRQLLHESGKNALEEERDKLQSEM
ncbi:MAG: hypothetical protein Q4C01_03065 [Clostridia bacterium]|nr:hypothetical protein [Clostridia bacterium]